MQIPLWLYLSSLLFALICPWQDIMASWVLRQSRALPTTSLLPNCIKPFLPAVMTSTFQHKSNPNQRQHPFTSTTRNMASKQFLEALKDRRSIYALKKESTISDKAVQDIIEQVLAFILSPLRTLSYSTGRIQRTVR